MSEIVSFEDITWKDLEAAYRNADVFLLPLDGGLPNAMVEAMAGLVPVISAVGNIPSVVTHGEKWFV